jgi:hypothetical protein
LQSLELEIVKIIFLGDFPWQNNSLVSNSWDGLKSRMGICQGLFDMRKTGFCFLVVRITKKGGEGRYTGPRLPGMLTHELINWLAMG